MVLIADAHVSEARDNVAEFFAMLSRLAELPHDVVFLGDILDLWIALPRYEESLHDRFLAWCRDEASRRTVGLVEGNHEFFVAKYHGESFTFAAEREFLDAGARLYLHGDTINQSDIGYRLLRFATKNPVTLWIERLLPRGPTVARRLKQYLNNRRRGIADTFPEDQIRRFSDQAFAEGAAVIYLGHFHGHHVLTDAADRRCEIVPAWKNAGEILLVQSNEIPGSVLPWRDL